MNKNIKIGADPEVFLFKNNSPESAIGTINGTKENPLKISDNGHFVQVDNVLLEFNVPPVNNPIEMFNNITFVMEWFKNRFSNDNYEIKISSSEIFDKSQLSHPDSQRFGCDPDYNVWTEQINPSPSAKTFLRVAGGHLHISYPGASIQNSLDLIKLFDLYIGVPSVLLDRDKRRKSQYGQAGSFRFKNYSNGDSGFEYRVLSNFWIKDEQNINFIFGQINKIFEAKESNMKIENQSKLGYDIIKSINSSNIGLAKRLIKENNLI